VDLRRSEPWRGVIDRRKVRRVPSQETLERVQWLEALVAEFGTDEVARWPDGPPAGWGFDSWREGRVRLKSRSRQNLSERSSCRS